MKPRDVITEATIQAALEALQKRIAIPPPPTETRYSRKEAFLKLRSKAREALAAGHSLEVVLEDLKGVGLGMTISTARQYLKPGKKISRGALVGKSETLSTQPIPTAPAQSSAQSGMKRGTFAVNEDDKEI